MLIIHNRDSSDFMKKEKFLQYVLRKTKLVEPYEWDFLDETGSNIIEHVVENKDQGPGKECGEYGWNRHQPKEDISQASEEKIV